MFGKIAEVKTKRFDNQRIVPTECVDCDLTGQTSGPLKLLFGEGCLRAKFTYEPLVVVGDTVDVGPVSA